MPIPGDIYYIPFPENKKDMVPYNHFTGAPRVCLLRCKPSDSCYRGVIVSDETSEGAQAGEGHIIAPSPHTRSKRVLVLFMDLDVPVDPRTLSAKCWDFVCGDTLIAALMMAQNNLTGGFDIECLGSFATDENPDDMDVEGNRFDENYGYHVAKKRRITDRNGTSVTFFTGNGLACYTDYYEDDMREHARYVEMLAMRDFYKSSE